MTDFNPNPLQISKLPSQTEGSYSSIITLSTLFAHITKRAVIVWEDDHLIPKKGRQRDTAKTKYFCKQFIH